MTSTTPSGPMPADAATAPADDASARTAPAPGVPVPDGPVPDEAIADGSPTSPLSETTNTSTSRLGRKAPLPVAAVTAAAWAALIGYASVAVLTVGLAVEAGGSPWAALRIAAHGWLLAHGVAVNTPTDRITLIPLAVTFVVAWRLTRAGVHCGRVVVTRWRGSAWGPGVAAGAVAVAYAAIGTCAAALANTDDVHVDLVRAACTYAVFGFVAAAAGASWRTGVVRGWLRAVPQLAKDAVRAGLTATVLMVAVGAAAGGASLALHGSDAADVLNSYRAGIAGQAGLTLIGVAYLPNLSLWAVAYLLGPGFSVGTATLISPTTVMVGPMPAVPVLAAVPAGPKSDLVASLLIGVPLAAAVLAGWLASRHRAETHWGRATASALLAGPVAGTAVQVMTWLSSGGLGSGRLATLGVATIGAGGWRIGGLTTVVVSLGALAGLGIVRVLAVLRR